MISSKNPRLTGNRILTVKQRNLVLLLSVKHIKVYKLLQHQVNVRSSLVLLHSVKHVDIFKLLQHKVNVMKYYKIKTNCVPQSLRYGSLVMLLKFVLAAKEYNRICENCRIKISIIFFLITIHVSLFS